MYSNLKPTLPVYSATFYCPFTLAIQSPVDSPRSEWSFSR